MAWRIEIDKDVQREMKKLDKQVAKRITAKLWEVSQLDDPRSMGKGLTGNLAGLWRYRVGDYRIICDIEDGVLLILVVDVAHRREVYKRRG
ncbi:MAG: type II toxin-antitoxin system RelE/ParE family toxin [Atopobiaceae bacterium]|nr:type II toxin-antitoxin system RelE/ParE family toxin [Atopobiaceae bacterium]